MLPSREKFWVRMVTIVMGMIVMGMGMIVKVLKKKKKKMEGEGEENNKGNRIYKIVLVPIW